MNSLELIAYTQRIISDQGLQVWGGEETILAHLDTAYQKVHGRLSNYDNGIGEVYTDFTWAAPAAGKSESTFNLPRYFEQIKLVEMLDGSGRKLNHIAWPADQVSIQYPGYANYYGYVWWIRNNRLTVDTQWGNGLTQPTTLRVFFYREPAPMLVFQPSATAAGTITFPTEPYNRLGKINPIDGWYDGTTWEIVDGKGTGQIFDIDTFVGSTKVGTLVDGQTLSPVPDTSSIIASVPSVPGRAHALIAYETALDGARIEENVSAASLLEMERKDRWRDLERTMSVRQVQMSRAFLDTE